MRSTMGQRRLIALVVVGLVGSASRASALTAEVRDEAGFFKPETVTEANEVIKEIKQRSKRDLLIDTVGHVEKGKRQEATSHDPDVKARYFADWAEERARDAGVNGIYVLITRDPAHVEVVVGNHTREVFPKSDRHELTQILLSHFRKKEYDEGLLKAVRFVHSTLKAEPKQGGAAAPVGPGRSSLPHQPPGADGSTGGGLGRYLGLGLVVLLGVWLLSAVVRALTRAGAPRAPGGYGGPFGPTAGPGGPAGYGYGPAGGGGGLFTSLVGGLFGAAAGSWLYDRFSSGQSHPADPFRAATPESTSQDTDYTAEGGDFGSSDSSDGAEGGDFDASDSFDGDDGGGDVGGGDFGDDNAAGGDF